MAVISLKLPSTHGHCHQDCPLLAFTGERRGLERGAAAPFRVCLRTLKPPTGCASARLHSILASKQFRLYCLFHEQGAWARDVLNMGDPSPNHFPVKPMGFFFLRRGPRKVVSRPKHLLPKRGQQRSCRGLFWPVCVVGGNQLCSS